MANPFLNAEDRDIETAIMLENAIVHDIGNAVAYTDGDRIFINTDDNLFNILPNYSHKMLKWLLWHERYHKELRHHNRFFRYLEELDNAETEEKFQVSKEEVNIIMDILVHDSLSKMFPELVETAQENLAQMRNRNSLKYTFTTATLEEMLEEYRKHKEETSEDKGGTTSEEEDTDGEETKKGKASDEDKGSKGKAEKKEEGKSSDGKVKGHSKGGSSEPKDTDTKAEDREPTIEDGATKPEEDNSEHDKTDWSKLEEIDSKEFITRSESSDYMREIEELKRKKIRLGRLTETLNGLVTSTRRRSYSMPSTISVGGGVVLKGSVPGYTKLYLVFDASGSMGAELQTFKEIISKSIPQAMDIPCEWFAGYGHSIQPYKFDHGDGYYKGKFKDILSTRASNGYDDDGDRVIELCWQAEQAGYSPIGVTDGGGRISWSKDKLKQLKRTVLVGPYASWLEKVKEINPKIQTLNT